LATTSWSVLSEWQLNIQSIRLVPSGSVWIDDPSSVTGQVRLELTGSGQEYQGYGAEG
jgi:hypothetical protein